MLSEKEKEAIRNLENLSEYGLSTTLNPADLDKMKTVLNLITKLQKENELAKEQLKKQCEIADERNNLLLKNKKLQKGNEEKDEKIRNFENECMKFKSFCRRIRQDGHDVDLFNQGQEHKCNQFLNLINGESHWDYKGKYFDDTDNQIKKYLGIERRNEGC